MLNSAKNIKFLKYSLEHDLSLLMDWYKANKLSLNVNKRVLLQFWPGEKQFNIEIDGMTISNSKYTRFLGVYVDVCLTWKEHTNILYTRLLNNKKLLLNAKNLLPESCLLKVYYAHIYSHIMYGLRVWGTMCPKALQNSLYRLQQECVKIIQRRQKDDINQAFKTHKIICLPDLINLQQEKLDYMVSHKMLQQPIIDLFNIHGGKKAHQYPTRNKLLLNIQPHQNSLFNRGFLCRSIVNYNHIPGTTKKAKTLKSFVSKAKECYLY